MSKPLSRRAFLHGSVLAAAVTTLAACQPKSTPGPTPAPTIMPTPAPLIAKAEPTKVQPTPAPQAAGCAMDWKPTLPSAKKYSPAVKISTNWPEGIAVYVGTDNVTNNPLYNRVKENLGIEYTINWQAAGDAATQRWNADVAAGTLPDMFNVTTAINVENVIQGNMVEEISAQWDKLASPLVKEKLTRDHPMWVCVTKGNKQYGVPYLNGPARNLCSTGYIRKDWLDKLNLKAPTTVVELEETMRAFMKAGLGKYGLSVMDVLPNYYHSLDHIYGAYGVMPAAWRPDEKGGLQYDSTNPKVKGVLELLARWYKDGLLDPELGTYMNAPECQKRIASGNAGIHFSPWFDWSWVLIKTEQENKGWQWTNFSSPKGPDGRQGRRGSPDFGQAVCFRKGVDPIKIEAALNHLNWQVDMHVNWEKYQQYGEWRNSGAWVQGYEWDFDDKCELKKGKIDLTYTYMMYVGFAFPHLCYPNYQADIFQDILKWYKADPKTLNKVQRFLMQDAAVQHEAETYSQVMSDASLDLPTLFVGPPPQSMRDSWGDLTKLERTTMLEIITGRKPLTAFDQFVTDWKKGGGDKVTLDVNAWYATQKKQ